MKLSIVSPTKAIVKRSSIEELELLKELLTYTNTANAHLLKRHSKNRFWMINNRETWQARYEEIKKSVHQTLVFFEDGNYYIRPGSIPYLEGKITLEVQNDIKYPTPKKVAWSKPLPFELYPYQQESVDKLIEAKHGGVSITTGGGKTYILLKLLREIGLPAVLVVPSKSIFNELLEKAQYHLGKANVGGYGAGKKDIKKKFTIAISDSLVNLEKGTEAYEFFANKQVFLGDEAHSLPSETLEKVCHGVLANIPYRFFCSGTHTRGDGAVPLLQSITGSVVHSLTTQEAVEGGYICPHSYKIIEIESSNPNYNADDALEMKRIHHLRNKNIAAFITKLTKLEATARRRQSLVLVEELSQISMLVKLLKSDGIPVAYAHSESKKERLEELGLEKVDPNESVEKFNKGEAMVLIGTSCIAVGTNIFPCHNTFNWVGGTSEIKAKQGAVGRSVRLGKHNPWHENCTEKTHCTIYDFDVYDVYLMSKHCEDRIKHYEESGSEIKRIKLRELQIKQR